MRTKKRARQRGGTVRAPAYGSRPAAAAADATRQSTGAKREIHRRQWILDADLTAASTRSSLSSATASWRGSGQGTQSGQWLKAGVVERAWLPRREGTTQGGVIRPALMNVASMAGGAACCPVLTASRDAAKTSPGHSGAVGTKMSCACPYGGRQKGQARWRVAGTRGRAFNETSQIVT